MATPDEPWVACPVCKCAVTQRKMARHLRRVHGEQSAATDALPPKPPPQRPVATHQPPAAAFGPGKLPPLHSRTVTCPSCGYMINEVLIDGHVEVCRARKRKQAAQARKKAREGTRRGGATTQPVPARKRRRKKAKRQEPAGGDLYAAGLVVEKGRLDWRHRQS